MLKSTLGPSRFWTEVLPGTTSPDECDLHILSSSCVRRGSMAVGHPVCGLGWSILQTTAIVPSPCSRTSLEPVHPRRSLQRPAPSGRPHCAAWRAVQAFDLHWIFWLRRRRLFHGRHLLLWIDESLNRNHVSWHAALVRLLLIRVVPHPVNVVGLLERLHVKVRDLRGFRRSVRWGVSNFRLHSGCVYVLECTRGKPEKQNFY